MPRSLTLIGLALLALPRGANAYCLDKFPGQSNYAAWASQPVKYRVSTSLTDAATLAAIDAAFKSWGSVQCSTLSFTKDAQFSMSAVPFSKDTSHINIYWVTKASELPSGMDSKYFLYHSRIFGTKGQIVASSIALNAMTFKWSTTGKDTSSFDVQNVMTHYIGELIGLAESETKGAVMYPDVTSGQTSKHTLTGDDVAGVQYLYLAAGCNQPPAPDATGCSNGPMPPPPPPADSGVAPVDGGAPPTTLDGSAPLPVGEAGLAADSGGVASDHGVPGGQCTSSANCAADEVCTAEGRCVKVGSGASDGGGCALAPCGPAAPLPLLLLLLLLGLTLRRRS
jgi:hypothetical protein